MPIRRAINLPTLYIHSKLELLWYKWNILNMGSDSNKMNKAMYNYSFQSNFRLASHFEAKRREGAVGIDPTIPWLQIQSFSPTPSWLITQVWFLNFYKRKTCLASCHYYLPVLFSPKTLFLFAGGFRLSWKWKRPRHTLRRKEEAKRREGAAGIDPTSPWSRVVSHPTALKWLVGYTEFQTYI